MKKVMRVGISLALGAIVVEIVSAILLPAVVSLDNEAATYSAVIFTLLSGIPVVVLAYRILGRYAFFKKPTTTIT
ncbi:hypothetical protein [Candidatus Nitrososphaera evergladensis]|jgi:Kef-type K+ transport system membrane component KefB|uniref:hypothetical protein n=1 Tax=Candidatus Nitrososphaera evergladensis TaxID=1459637 RepID=UPI001D03C639|nr:hypothetical protein [Candidatus Nitrososphaera evergladensis]